MGTFEGLVAFSVTPTRPDESIDEDRLCAHIDTLIAAGVDGIAIFGSTGSIGSFSEAERRRVAEVTTKHVGRRVPVAIGTGAMTTAEAVRLSEHAEKVGADALLVVPITYWPLNEAELCAHYRAIASATQLPIFAYNSPVLTGVDMTPNIIVRLWQDGRVKYLKESARDLLRIPQVKEATEGRLRIFGGRDDSIVEALRLGADGWTSGAANIVPRACRRLFNFANDSQNEFAAHILQRRLAPLMSFLMDKGHVSVCHTALEILGRPIGTPRRPILPLAGEDRIHLEGILRSLEEEL
ncbi:dihydrodipicolinate synthase family protein [Pendulispora rubella]|uniref:Dihydrodipicolinate synthase family protein n=1 Tax=Pendulispora rubella TaxID=2741070 RepID=A0ABZ2LDW5_9BACT